MENGPPNKTPPSETTTADPAADLRLGLRLHLTLWLALALVALILARASLFPDKPGAIWITAGLLGALALSLWLPGRLGSFGLVVVHSLSFALAVLVIAELTMTRASEPEVAHTRYPYPYRMHGFVPSIAPGESKRHRKVSTNDTGLRGSARIEPKEPGVLRALVLGGSTIFGISNTADETPPAWLEILLRERFENAPLAGVERIEVVNGGQGWYNSTQELIFFFTELALYEPDLVIVVDGYNDLHHSLLWGDRPPSNHVTSQMLQKYLNLPGTFTEKGWDHALHEVLGVSALAQWARLEADDVVALRSSSKFPRKIPRTPQGEEGLQLVEHRLLMNWVLMDHLAKSVGFRALFALQPVIFTKKAPAEREVRWMENFKRTEDISTAWSELESWLEREAQRLGLAYFSSDVYVNQEEEAIFLDYCHVDDHGSRLLAQAIEERVAAELEDWPWEARWDGVRYGFSSGDPIWRP